MSASIPPAAATVFLLEGFTHRFCSAPAAESCDHADTHPGTHTSQSTHSLVRRSPLAAAQ